MENIRIENNGCFNNQGLLARRLCNHCHHAEQHTYDIFDSKKLLSIPHVVDAIFSLN
jgi:hypothetical protein